MSTTARTKKRAGRPLLDETEKKTERRNLRFRLSEIETITVQADRLGLSVADYLHQRCVAGVARPVRYRKGIDPALVSELNELGVAAEKLAQQQSRLGNIAMQIVRAINFDGRPIPGAPSWTQLPDEIRENQLKVQQNQRRVDELLAKVLADHD